ncbi:ABC transporter permease [Hymenobacter aerilatus]|uniref:ABC transporter permease n=1 Tax=Hymenobacter aerilatus TaxID=2932251 RepID=A0A8T9SXM2_9BACT|nr:ABC transporter permease [Hymenobacter aerilatus]UOR05493.1 ABC transporter permease [Hymenobacter aerilatus]
MAAPWLPLPYPPDQLNLAATMQPPSTTGHWLGTDPYGRDVLALLLFGSRTALLISLPTAILTTVAGTLVGAAAGFYRNRPLPIDSLITGLMAVISSIPRLILVLALAAVQPPSINTLLVLLLCTYWIGPARLVRAEMLRTREVPFIEAARAAGIPGYRILLRHALPNTWQPALAIFPLSIASIIALETTLSFLGVGLPPEIASWGRLLAAFSLDPSAWWLLVYPAFTLFITSLALRQLSK